MTQTRYIVHIFNPTDPYQLEDDVHVGPFESAEESEDAIKYILNNLTIDRPGVPFVAEVEPLEKFGDYVYRVSKERAFREKHRASDDPRFAPGTKTEMPF